MIYYFFRKVEAYNKKVDKAQQEKVRAQQRAEDEYWHDEGDKNMQKKAERVK